MLFTNSSPVFFSSRGVLCLSLGTADGLLFANWVGRWIGWGWATLGGGLLFAIRIIDPVLLLASRVLAQSAPSAVFGSRSSRTGLLLDRRVDIVEDLPVVMIRGAGRGCSLGGEFRLMIFVRLPHLITGSLFLYNFSFSNNVILLLLPVIVPSANAP